MAEPKQINIKKLNDLIKILSYLYKKYGNLPVYMNIDEENVIIHAVTFTTDVNDAKYITITSY